MTINTSSTNQRVNLAYIDKSACKMFIYGVFFKIVSSKESWHITRYPWTWIDFEAQCQTITKLIILSSDASPRLFFFFLQIIKTKLGKIRLTQPDYGSKYTMFE